MKNDKLSNNTIEYYLFEKAGRQKLFCFFFAIAFVSLIDQSELLVLRHVQQPLEFSHRHTKIYINSENMLCICEMDSKSGTGFIIILMEFFFLLFTCHLTLDCVCMRSMLLNFSFECLIVKNKIFSFGHRNV